MQLKDSKHEKGFANDFFATRIIEGSKAISKFYKVPLLNPLMKKHLDTLINDLQVHINASEKLLARSVAVSISFLLRPEVVIFSGIYLSNNCRYLISKDAVKPPFSLFLF